MDDAAAQHLEPLVLVEHIQLKGRLREGEVVVAPPRLQVGIVKNVLDQAFQRRLQVLGDDVAFRRREPGLLVRKVRLAVHLFLTK